MVEENFLEAFDKFKAFLAENNHPNKLVWVFREDVIWKPDQILVNELSIKGNEMRAEKYFNQGKEAGFGIALNAFCVTEDQLICKIDLPTDEIDAEYKMVSKDLKMSFTTPLFSGAVIPFSASQRMSVGLGFKRFQGHKNLSLKDTLPSKKSL